MEARGLLGGQKKMEETTERAVFCIDFCKANYPKQQPLYSMSWFCQSGIQAGPV